MRILVLDDDDARHGYFAKQFIGHEVTHVHTYTECIQTLLDNDPFEVVFLDHDLNDHGYRSTADEKTDYVQRSLTRFSREGELDGRDVAEDMVRLFPVEKRPYQVVVHSWNPQGAKEMMSILKDAGFNVQRWEFDPRANLKINGKP